MIARLLVLGILLATAGCAGRFPNPAAGSTAGESELTSVASRSADAPFSIGQMGEFMRQIAGQGTAARQNETRRLQNLERRTPMEKLKLAYVLTLENASPENLAQAQEQLEGLELSFEDPAIRQFVTLMQRMIASEGICKQEKKRAGELQEKLHQLNKLELELQKRSQDQQKQGK
jgi:hypothetical protein